MRVVRLAAMALPLLIPAQQVAAQCAMPVSKRHIDPARTAIRSSASGTAAIYFRADVDVNTDGAGRSYHPADPRGQSLALNNIANAITAAWDANGRPINCAPRRGPCYTRFIQAFEGARDSGWAPSGAPRIQTRHIIPWAPHPTTGRLVPCTVASGPFSGYFVSQTSFIVDRNAAECDPGRYLDAMTFNAAVLPGRADWRSQGRRAAIGDLAVVRSPSTGRIAYAILGDSGPRASIGEVSIALAAQLRGQVVAPDASYQSIRRLALSDGQYLIFPGTNIRSRVTGPITQADIDRLGAELFAAWGGEARLRQCATP